MTKQKEDWVMFTVNTGLEFKPVKETINDFHEFLYTNSPILKVTEGSIVITTKPTKPILPQQYSNNGFVSAIFEAYNLHRNLILSPDDVWLAVTTSLSLYVNAHAEEMRYKFVEHEGQIELDVSGGGSLYTANYNQLIDQMSNLIDEKTINDTRDWFVPSFSTTTKEIATAGKVVAMAVLKKYLTYIMYLKCGIPNVTLRGTLDDREKLKTKIGKQGEFGKHELTHWGKLLDFVIDKFIDSYQGNADKEFWNRIAAITGRGSGPRYTAGWVNIFMPFSDTGQYNLNEVNAETGNWGKIDTNKVPSSVVECPVKIDDNGVVHNTKFIAGHIAVEYDSANNSVSPSIQWAIIDLPADAGDVQTEQNKNPYRFLRGPNAWKRFKQGLYYNSM